MQKFIRGAPQKAKTLFLMLNPFLTHTITVLSGRIGRHICIITTSTTKKIIRQGVLISQHDRIKYSNKRYSSSSHTNLSKRSIWIDTYLRTMREVTKKMATDLVVFAVSNVAFYFAFKAIMRSLDPNRQKRLDAKKQSDDKLHRLGVQGKDLNLNEYEEQIATELILPSQITVDFNSIGGLDGIISSLQESVIAPLCYPQLFANASGRNGLLGAPKGVLLFGPPGTGKTMLAKALAKESGATFINMHVSTLTNKWFGESNKLVAALFSLARKLQPSIIFIDEIDSFLRERATGDHEVTGMMKAEFMTLWDGLTSSTDRIMVLGATNRPSDIDSAILRRMPKRYAVRLPDSQQRRKILEIMLAEVRLDKGFNLDAIVNRTEGFSGSDLKEICRGAAMQPVREFIRSAEGRKRIETVSNNRREVSSDPSSYDSTIEANGVETRPIRNADFFVVESVKDSSSGQDQDSLD